MKINHFSLLFFSVLALGSCKKYSHLSDDLKGMLYIHGRLQMLDTVNTTGKVAPVPLGGATVQIGYQKDNAVNYIYSVKADSNGYFTFNNLSKDSTYLIFCKTTVDSMIFYQQRNYPLSASIDTTLLTLYPSQQWQNGLAFEVTDNTGQPLNSCQVCLFRSLQLFQADTCSGASYVLSTNPYGVAAKLNLPAGTYYAHFTDVIYSKLTLTGQGTIVVQQTGITKGSVVVK